MKHAVTCVNWHTKHLKLETANRHWVGSNVTFARLSVSINCSVWVHGNIRNITMNAHLATPSTASDKASSNHQPLFSCQSSFHKSIIVTVREHIQMISFHIECKSNLVIKKGVFCFVLFFAFFLLFFL